MALELPRKAAAARSCTFSDVMSATPVIADRKAMTVSSRLRPIRSPSRPATRAQNTAPVEPMVRKSPISNSPNPCRSR